MTTKHTPGPWRLRKAGEYADNTIQTFDFIEVADRRYVFVEGRSEREAQANARLIAAAPDLLDALERLVALCADENLTGGAVDNAREAIAKAQTCNKN